MLKCEICGAEAKGVCSSGLAAYSMAICQECLDARREPWFVLVGNMLGIDDVADWCKPIYKATMKHYGKTNEDLLEEIADLEKKMYKDWENEEEVGKLL